MTANPAKHPLDVVAKTPRDLARAWADTAARWKRMSPTDPISDTLDYCARELFALVGGRPSVERRNTIKLLAAPAPMLVYAIRRRAAAEVKIGISVNPVARLMTLQGANGELLELAAVVEGGRRKEIELHERFGSARKQREWFHETPEITAWIEEVSKR